MAYWLRLPRRWPRWREWAIRIFLRIAAEHCTVAQIPGVQSPTLVFQMKQRLTMAEADAIRETAKAAGFNTLIVREDLELCVVLSPPPAPQRVYRRIPCWFSMPFAGLIVAVTMIIMALFWGLLR